MIWFFIPFKPEFPIGICIHYKPWIAVEILDFEWMKMTWSGLKIDENYHVVVQQFHGNFQSKTSLDVCKWHVPSKDEWKCKMQKVHFL